MIDIPNVGDRVAISPDVCDAVKDAISNLGYPLIGTPATVTRVSPTSKIVYLIFDGTYRLRSIHCNHLEFYIEGIIT